MWNEVYRFNQYLDDIFIERYSESEPRLFEKNCVELLTELGEFCNETKCFKYWSIKEPNKELVLDEFADCVTILLTFFHHLDLDLTLLPVGSESRDSLLLFNELFQLSSCFMVDINADLVKKTFACLIQLGDVLGFTEEEMVSACKKKQEKVKLRLEDVNY